MVNFQHERPLSLETDLMRIFFLLSCRETCRCHYNDKGGNRNIPALLIGIMNRNGQQFNYSILSVR